MKNANIIGGFGLGGVIVGFAFMSDQSDTVKIVALVAAAVLTLGGRWLDRRKAKADKPDG